MTTKEKSVGITHALNGIRIVFGEWNIRIHLVATILVTLAGFYFDLSASQWALQIFAISLVFCVEILNTAIEFLCDFVHLERHDTIKKIKDLSAAAVLCSAISAILIGCLIYIPILSAL